MKLQYVIIHFEPILINCLRFSVLFKYYLKQSRIQHTVTYLKRDLEKICRLHQFASFDTKSVNHLSHRESYKICEIRRRQHFPSIMAKYRIPNILQSFIVAQIIDHFKVMWYVNCTFSKNISSKMYLQFFKEIYIFLKCYLSYF